MLFPKNTLKLDDEESMCILRSRLTHRDSLRSGYGVGIVLNNKVDGFYNYINYGIVPICLI